MYLNCEIDYKGSSRRGNQFFKVKAPSLQKQPLIINISNPEIVNPKLHFSKGDKVKVHLHVNSFTSHGRRIPVYHLKHIELDKNLTL